MDLQLNGKCALVTGSTAGIGFAIAAALTKEGDQIILNGRQRVRGDSACGRLRNLVHSSQAVLPLILARLPVAHWWRSSLRQKHESSQLGERIVFISSEWGSISRQKWFITAWPRLRNWQSLAVLLKPRRVPVSMSIRCCPARHGLKVQENFLQVGSRAGRGWNRHRRTSLLMPPSYLPA